MANQDLSLEIDASEIQELLRQFPEYEDIALREFVAATNSSLIMFEELIKGNTPVGAGPAHLRTSFQITNATLRGQSIEGNVSTSLAHALPIERGRTPGSKMPPIDPIEFWVKRKLGITENSRGVAFVIARSIAAKGFKKRDGYRMVETAFEEGSPRAIRLFDSAIERAIEKIEEEIEAI